MTTPEIEGYTGLVEVGRGASATVYRAEQPMYARTVALKVIDAAGLDEDALRRFERECHAMGMLSGHSNIAPIFDSGRTPDGRPFLVTLYAPDGSLADKLKRDGALDWRDAVSIGEKLSGALSAAHDAGILHRDIKPENVLLSRYGEPLLADFGIARVASHTATREGLLTATIAHAAPELLAGSPPSVATDIYALGSTLYTLLEGQPAFVRATDESIVPVLARITTDPVPDLTNRGVPAAVAAAISAAMAKDPEDRPATADDLQARLRAALEDERRSTPGGTAGGPNETVQRDVLAGAAASAGPTAAAGKPAPGRRNRRILAASAVVVVALVASLVVMLRPAGAEVVVTGPLDPGDDFFLVDAVATETPASVPATSEPAATESSPVPLPELRSDGGVSGGERGLYGGTRNQAACDIEGQIAFLSGDEAKLRAFAGAVNVEATPDAVGTFLRGLTTVVLRTDARVTNNTFREGRAHGFQAVLKAGTAVLADERGVPRVRCACGNPLDLPRAVSNPSYTGATDEFDPDTVATIRPTTRDIEAFELVAPDGSRFARPVGTEGEVDFEIPADEAVDPEGTPDSGPQTVALDLGEEADINDYRVAIHAVDTAPVLCTWFDYEGYQGPEADPPCAQGESKSAPEDPFLIVDFSVCVPEDATEPFVLSQLGPDFEPYEYRFIRIDGFDAGGSRLGPFNARIPGGETRPYASQLRHVEPGDCFEGFWQWMVANEETLAPATVIVEGHYFGDTVTTYEWQVRTGIGGL